MAASDKKSAKKAKKIRSSTFSRNSLVLFVLVFGAIGAYVLLHSNAAAPPAAPSLYLTPDSASVTAGNTFTATVYENSGSTPINFVQANLSYNSTYLSVVSVDTSTSDFGGEAQKCFGSSCPGLVKIGRFTPGGTSPVSGLHEVAKINFKALSGPSGAVDFASGSLLAVASTSTAIPGLNEAGGSYAISGSTTPPPSPPPSSPPPSSPPPASGGGGGSTTHPPSPSSSSTGHSSSTTKTPSPSPSSSSPSPSSPVASPSPSSSSPDTTAPTTTKPSEGVANSSHVLTIGAAAAGFALVLTGIFWALQHVRANARLGADSHVFTGATGPAPSSPPGSVIKANSAPAPAPRPVPQPAKLAVVPVPPPPPTPAPAKLAEKIVAPSKMPTGNILKPNIPKKA